MKISETDILLIPGYGKLLPSHWMLRWQEKMANARVVKQKKLRTPSKKDWLETLVKEVEACERPVVLVAHSLGTILVAHGAHVLKDKIRGAFLVAPSDWDRDNLVSDFDGGDFRPVPTDPLPFRSHVVFSQDDPYCTVERSHTFASAWGSTIQDAGHAGHINAQSGHGPWPEGLMSFAHFMKKID
ncbi:MAG: serine hydrolase family protein [Rhodobacteraceae bacterium]|nr:serine hydrolase family protein [Paracoccaceae bacterium]